MKSITSPMLLLSVILLTYGFQCKEDDEFENIYELELPFKVSPVKKEYRINDTISIAVILRDRSLKDLLSKEQILIECTDIPIVFSAGVRYSDFNLLNSDNVFEVVVDTDNFPHHELTNNGQFSSFSSFLSEDIFDKEQIDIVKLIPKKKGVFMINPAHFKNIFINRAELCDEFNPVYDKGIMRHIFDVPNTNPELLQESPLPGFVIISGDQIPKHTNEKRVFWFKVTD
jgi:hypothetical protein